jgi:hypothetical protein
LDSIEIQQNYQIAAKFEELSALTDGWYGGQCNAPDKEKLAKLATHMIGDYPETLAIPLIVPTQEGNLLLEWDAEGHPSLDIDLGSMTSNYHAFSPEGGEIERSFELGTDTVWPAFFEFLQENIKPCLA